MSTESPPGSGLKTCSQSQGLQGDFVGDQRLEGSQEAAGGAGREPGALKHPIPPPQNGSDVTPGGFRKRSRLSRASQLKPKAPVAAEGKASGAQLQGREFAGEGGGGPWQHLECVACHVSAFSLERKQVSWQPLHVSPAPSVFQPLPDAPHPPSKMASAVLAFGKYFQIPLPLLISLV